MLKREELLKKFREEEKIEVAKIYDKYIMCDRSGQNTFTDFVSPNIFYKVKQVMDNANYIKFFYSGGIKNTERKIICFATENSVEDILFPITSLKIKYNKKFSKGILHKDVLGSLIGLGIERKKIGDIIISEEGIYVLVENDIVSYVMNNIIYIGKTKIKIEEIEIEKINIKESEEKLYTSTVASKRLDVIISKLFNMSRSVASELIKKEKVFVNWIVVNSNKLEVKEGDMVTVRKYGRCKIERFIGKSKKGKERIEYYKY